MRGIHHVVCFVALLSVVTPPGMLQAAGREVPLVEAARKADAVAVRALVERRVDVNAGEVDGTTALHWAAYHGDLKSVELLIGHGANAKAVTRYGVTPLSLAAVNGHGVVIDRLLKAGADANSAQPGGETALMTAARAGKPEAIKVLLAHGADVNAREGSRAQTALMWAAAEGHVAAIRVLAEAGADINARSTEKDFRNYEPIPGTGAIGGVQNGVKIEFSPLLFAVRAGKVDAVRTLLDLGAHVNETTPDGTSALVIAAINAKWDVGAYLLERGADPNAAAQGWNALHQVARTRTYNLGIVPSPPPSGSVSSLDFARKLLAKGVNVNARMTREILNDGYRFTMSRLGATAYLIAAKGADAPMMRLLATLGADTLIPNNAGTTPLMAAAGVDLAFLGEDTGSHEEALEAITVALENPHDVNAVNAQGVTALHGAARRGAIPIVERLITDGAKLDAKNKQGLLPLTIALGYRKGRPLFLNEQRQLVTAAVIYKAMEQRGLPIDEDQDALALMRAEAGQQSPQAATR